MEIPNRWCMVGKTLASRVDNAPERGLGKQLTAVAMAKVMRLGSGAGFAADRLEPAVRLIERGRLHWIGFECLAERTLAMGQRERAADPAHGYNRYLETRLEACLPLCAANGTRLITNMGAANPAAAAAAAARIAGPLGLSVAFLEGDDVRSLIDASTPVPGLGATVGDVGRELVAANAYLGIDAILPAIATGAEVVITGRVADPSLFLAPLADHYGWAVDDWPRLGAGTVVGHLLECAAQVTGGYFADPGYKEVPGLADIGFPLAEVEADGSAVITKLAGDGGLVSPATVKEQLFYELHDPGAYKTPDVVADFSSVAVEAVGPDRVRVSGGSGGPRPETLKVMLAFDGGFRVEAGISYAGLGAADRARLAREILRARLGDVAPLRIDLIGLSSLHAACDDASTRDSTDVRVHVAARVDDRRKAERLLWEVEALYTCGPAGGAGYRGAVTPVFVTHDAFLPRDAIEPRFRVIRP
jgi:hypothetical protein